MDSNLNDAEKSEKCIKPNNSCCMDPNPKLSVISVVCRICYDNEKEEILIAPCKCKGTVAFVHRTCLETWLAESNTTKCELCHEFINTERTPKYTSTQSVWRWCWQSPRIMGHAVRGDIIACTMITPLAIIITYVCLFSSEYYNQRKFATVPAARWTSVSLLVMIGIMLMGYYLWVYSVIRMNARMWYNWWQRACVVRYIPPSSVTISCSDHVSGAPNNTPNVRGTGENGPNMSPSVTDSEDELITQIREHSNPTSMNKNHTVIVVRGAVDGDDGCESVENPRDVAIVINNDDEQVVDEQ